MQRDNAYLKTKAYRVILFLFLSIFTLSAFAQKGDSTLFFRSSLSVTHNGFSFIPSFSLGKPAAILDVAVGNKRLSFEPQFRFALEGKPWSFIFIYRYKFIDRDKFQFTFGGHIPAIVFRTETVTTKYRNKRCSYLIAIFSYGAYTQLLALKKCKHWLKLSEGHGFQSDATRNTYFIGLRSHFSNIKLPDKIFIRFNPQVFYLKTDDVDGFYATYTLTLAMRNFPLSISNIVNKAIQSDIPSKDFDWNVSLIYSFDKKYVRR